jgi:hypothetical protein
LISQSRGLGDVYKRQTTMYSNRRKNKINIFKTDIENFISAD